MLNIKLREDLCKFAWDTVNKRNFGNRSVGANGSKEQQYTGILGEAVIYDIVYGKLPEYNEAGIVDIVISDKKVDIKTKAPLYEIKNKELNTIYIEEDVRKIGL